MAGKLSVQLRLPKDEIIQKYLSGIDAMKLATEFGTTHTTIYRFLIRNGIKLRNRSEVQHLIWQRPGAIKRASASHKKYYLEHPEERYKLGLQWRGKHHSLETKQKISIANSGIHHGLYGKHHTLETRRKMSISRMGIGNSFYGKHHTQESIRKTLEGQHKSLAFKPNKLEQQLLVLIGEACPGEYTYTGDRKVIINRLCPDYTNCNGQKKVIELFGNYWHTGNRLKSWRNTELGRIMSYKCFGFDCLVIWEDELKDTKILKRRIKRFNKCKRCYNKFQGIKIIKRRKENMKKLIGVLTVLVIASLLIIPSVSAQSIQVKRMIQGELVTIEFVVPCNEFHAFGLREEPSSGVASYVSSSPNAVVKVRDDYIEAVWLAILNKGAVVTFCYRTNIEEVSDFYGALNYHIGREGPFTVIIGIEDTMDEVLPRDNEDAEEDENIIHPLPSPIPIYSPRVGNTSIIAYDMRSESSMRNYWVFLYTQWLIKRDSYLAVRR